MSADWASSPRWRILAISSLALAALSATHVGLAVMAPELRLRFGLSVEDVGKMLGSVEVGMAFTLLGWGAAADRLGEKRCLIVGLFGACAAAAFAARSPDFVALLISLVGLGVFGGAICTSGPRMVLGAFGEGGRGRALAARQAAIPLSGLLVAVALAPIVLAYGTEVGFTLLAMLLGFAACGAIVVPHLPGSSRHPGELPTRRLRRDATIWRMAFASGLLVFGEVALIGFAAVYLVDTQGLSTPAAGVVMAGMLGFGALVLLAVSAWSDRSRRRVLPLRLIALGTAIGFGLLALLTEAPLAAVIAVMVMTGALLQCWMPLPTAILGASVPRGRHGTAIGIQQTTMAVLAGCSPFVFGWGVERFSWQCAFAGTAILALLALAFVRRADEPSSVAELFDA